MLVAQSRLTVCDPHGLYIARQAPLSMDFQNINARALLRMAPASPSGFLIVPSACARLFLLPRDTQDQPLWHCAGTEPFQGPHPLLWVMPSSDTPSAL